MFKTYRSANSRWMTLLVAMVVALFSVGGGLLLSPADAADPPPGCSDMNPLGYIETITVGGEPVVTACQPVTSLPQGIERIDQFPTGPALIFSANATIGRIEVVSAKAGEMGSPWLNLSVDSPAGPVTITIGASADYSIMAPGAVVAVGGELGKDRTFQLAGGIQAESVAAGDWGTLQIGTANVKSTKGIEVTNMVSADRGAKINIYTTGTGITAPVPTDPGNSVEALNGGIVAVMSSDTATALTSGTGTLPLYVAHGGKIELKWNNSIGDIDTYYGYWGEQSPTGDDKCLVPSNDGPSAAATRANAPSGSYVYYSMDRDDTNERLLLESLTGPMQVLKWEANNSFNEIEDGSACIKAAKGFGQAYPVIPGLNPPGALLVDYQIEAGSDVTIEMLPDRGFQFTGGTFTKDGGGTVAVTAKATSDLANTAVYTFTMPEIDVSVSGVFVEHPDFVAAAPAVIGAVAGGEITVPQNTVDNGNARVWVEEGTLDTVDERAFQSELAAGFQPESLTYLDMSLEKIILAGNTSTGWTDTLTAPASTEITLQLGSDLKGYTGYTVLHDTVAGVEKLTVTNYNSLDGTITFSTTGFSPFAIAHTGVRLPSGGGGGAPVSGRIAGADRFATAVEVSKAAFPNAGVPVVYVAKGSDFPDALAGSAAAFHAGGPLLLVTSNGIPSTTANELTRLQAGNIKVLGGAGSISETVLQALGSYTTGSVTRVAGADRYATAIALAQTFTAQNGAVMLVSGGNFPDALSAGTLFSSYSGPVLLVKPGEGLSAGVRAELARLAPSRVFILGGTASVSTLAESQAIVLGYQVIRLAGADRYATSAAIADWVRANSGFTGGVLAATGENFPDGLTAGVLSARTNAALLIANGTCWSRDASGVISRLGATSARIVGGNATMAPALGTLTSCG